MNQIINAFPAPLWQQLQQALSSIVCHNKLPCRCFCGYSILLMQVDTVSGQLPASLLLLKQLVAQRLLPEGRHGIQLHRPVLCALSCRLNVA
jgi:hypothetical protein